MPNNSFKPTPCCGVGHVPTLRSIASAAPSRGGLTQAFSGKDIMTEADGYYIYDTVVEGSHRYFASLLPHDTGFTAGLPSEAIIGEFTSGPETLTPDAFQQNIEFVKFMAYVIGKHASACPGLIAETRRQQNGFVYILDNRTPTPDDAVPPEDIIGGVEIANGKMLCYHGSPTYRILTDDGFMQLDPWLKDRLIEELVAIATGGGNEFRTSR